MNALTCRLMALSIALFLPGAALAQIDQQMDNIFGGMSNVGSPEVVQGQTRGVITGGSVTVRTGVMNIQPIGLKMPSIGAGCGGIDAYGGSFSYINKAEFTAFARKIAANAAGYAFKTALSSMCNTCAVTMTKLQDTVKDLNDHFRNSCEVAQHLVEGDAYSSWLNQKSTSAQTTSGASDDYNNAAAQGAGTDSPASTMAQQNPVLAAKLIPGNLVLRALKNVQAASWFEGTNDQILIDIMSLTGTVIVCVPGHGACVSDDGGVSAQSNQPTAFSMKGPLTFSELIYGAGNRGDTQSGGASSASGVQVFDCNDAECLAPTQKTLTNFRGMGDRVLDLMIGAPGDTAGGLVGKIAHNVGPLTSQEQGFMTGSGLYSGMAIAMARRDERAAREFATTYAPEIAAQILSNYVDQVILHTHIAVSVDGQDATGKMQVLLEQARDSARKERQAITQSLAGQGQIIAAFQSIMALMPPPDLPARVSTTTGTD